MSLSEQIASHERDVIELATEAVEEALLRQEALRQAEGLRAELDLSERFFSLVSHDLRSPLTVSKLSADLILRHADKPEVCRRLAERIFEASSRADRMIVDLLDASRLRADGHWVIHPAACDLGEVVRGVTEELALAHPGRCQCRVSGDGSGQWDGGALRRALENLVANAIKYGDGLVSVSLDTDTEPGMLVISVHNRGEPIPEAELPQLFHWYGRMRAAERSGKAGWGLGLVMVRAVAEAHGGFVRVTSSAGAGTCFSLVLPRRS